MKKYFLFVLAAVMTLGYATTTNAQDMQMKKERKNLTDEQIIKMRTDKMVQILMLDDETTAKFVPVYSQYLKERMECRNMKKKPDMQKDADKTLKTDAEVEDMIMSQFAQSRKMLDIREKYYAKLRKILSPKQILRIYSTEKADLGKMQKEMKKRKDKMGNRRENPNQSMGNRIQGPSH